MVVSGAENVVMRSSSPAPSRRQLAGFTLIELMIAVVVVAVLAAIALPSYQSSVRKARRADAMDAAVGVQHAQERHRSNHTAYAATLAAMGLSVSSTNSYYGAVLSAVSANGYTLTLTAASGAPQASDAGCTALTVVVTNASPVYGPAACWSK